MVPEAHPATKRPGMERAIIWLSLFGLLVILVLFAFLILSDREESSQDIADQVRLQALLLSEHAARLFDSAELALSTVVDETRGDGLRTLPNAARIHRRLHALAQRLPYVEAFWLHGPGGRLRLSSLAHPPPRQDASDQEFFVAHRENPDAGVHVSALAGGAEGRATFRVSRRLEGESGGFQGVASLTVDVGFFRNFYGQLPLPPDSKVVLLRAPDLTELVRQPPAMPGTRIRAAAALREAVVVNPQWGLFREVTDEDEVPRLVAYRRVQGFPLYVTVCVPLMAADAQWRQRVLLRLAEAGVALVILGLLTTLALREAGRQRAFQEALAERVGIRTAELEAAVHEVHHRVRNNLQVIGSLLNLQAARVRDPETREALTETIGRVHTISLVHQTMYAAGSVNRVEFHDYLATLASQLGDLYGVTTVTIGVVGDSVTLSLETAVPLALIVHEALANALAHAFPGRHGGKVVIRLQNEPPGLILTIEDDGIGPPDAATNGLGMRIMRQSATQVNARLELEPTAPGTRVRVHCRRV